MRLLLRPDVGVGRRFAGVCERREERIEREVSDSSYSIVGNDIEIF